MLAVTLNKTEFRHGEEMLATVDADFPEPGLVVMDDAIRPIGGDFALYFTDPGREWFPIEIRPNGATYRAFFSEGEGHGLVVVSLERLGKLESTSATYKEWKPPAINFQVGWSPPNSNPTDLNAMLAKYPNTKLVTLYMAPGAGLPSWTSGLLAAVPRDATLSLSVKDWPLNVAGWLAGRPASWTTPFLFTLDHEPEQQDSGDPTPIEFQEEWQDLCESLAGHSRRSEILLTPCYTEYAATLNAEIAPNWLRDFGCVSSFEGIDAVAFDIYDTGYAAYRSTQQAYAFALAHARSAGKPLLVRERGISRKGADASGPSAGTACAQAMRDQCAYLNAQPDVLGWSWFYRGGQILDSRLPEKQALTDMIAQYQ